MCPRFLFVDTNKSAHKGHHPNSRTLSTHGRNRTLTRILTGLKLQSGFGPRLPSTFSELKASYDSTFHQVLESTHSIEAMGLLLSLVQMMFLFMTVYFPSFLSFSSDSGSN